MPPLTRSTRRLTQRKEGFLRGLVLASTMGAGLLSLPFLAGGIGAWTRGRDNGLPLTVFGAVLLAIGLVVPRVVKHGWGRELAADHPLTGAGALPFGATARGDGVVLRPRAAIRIVPGLGAALCLVAAWGASMDHVNPIGTGVMYAAGIGTAVYWLVVLRRYEICLDHSGIWRRRRPRWRMAWQDLDPGAVLPHPRYGYDEDLVLRGVIARPGGAGSDTVRIRGRMLAISSTDLTNLVGYYGTEPGSGAATPFDTWS